jgi:hypothetical protein
MCERLKVERKIMETRQFLELGREIGPASVLGAAILVIIYWMFPEQFPGVEGNIQSIAITGAAIGWAISQFVKSLK